MEHLRSLGIELRFNSRFDLRCNKCGFIHKTKESSRLQTSGWLCKKCRVLKIAKLEKELRDMIMTYNMGFDLSLQEDIEDEMTMAEKMEHEEWNELCRSEDRKLRDRINGLKDKIETIQNM